MYPSVVTVDQFRGKLKAFANDQTWPDDAIEFWIDVATQMVNPSRWEDMTYLGIILFTAHMVVLDAMNQQAVAVGSLPGLARGAISAESVGPVSLSYDVASSTEEGGSFWNLTNYGIRYLYLARQYGMGPVYIGIGVSNPLNGPGWPGPWTYLFPNPVQ